MGKSWISLKLRLTEEPEVLTNPTERCFTMWSEDPSQQCLLGYGRWSDALLEALN